MSGSFHPLFGAAFEFGGRGTFQASSNMLVAVGVRGLWGEDVSQVDAASLSKPNLNLPILSVIVWLLLLTPMMY